MSFSLLPLLSSAVKWCCLGSLDLLSTSSLEVCRSAAESVEVDPLTRKQRKVGASVCRAYRNYVGLIWRAGLQALIENQRNFSWVQVCQRIRI